MRLFKVLCPLLILPFFLISCGINSNSDAPEDTAPKDFQHTVRYRGESLGLIAKWYTGNVQNWVKIREANPTIRPKRIDIGDVISIPAVLMRRTDPLTPQAMKKLRRRSSKKTIQVGQTLRKKQAAKVVVEKTPSIEADVPPVETARTNPDAESQETPKTTEVAGSDPAETVVEKDVTPAELDVDDLLRQLSEERSSAASADEPVPVPQVDVEKEDPAQAKPPAKQPVVGEKRDTQREQLLQELLSQ